MRVVSSIGTHVTTRIGHKHVPINYLPVQIHVCYNRRLKSIASGIVTVMDLHRIDCTIFGFFQGISNNERFLFDFHYLPLFWNSKLYRIEMRWFHICSFLLLCVTYFDKKIKMFASNDQNFYITHRHIYLYNMDACWIQQTQNIT